MMMSEDWTAAASDMLTVWDGWMAGAASEQQENADRLLRAAIFAAQAYKDAMASPAPDGATGALLRTFLVALIDWRDPQLDPLRAQSRVAASRAPDPVVNAGSCQPMDTIDSLFDQIRAIMDAAKDQADRYGHIAATIYVNALRHGATNADADAMVRGEINFISWMADVIEKRDRALPAAPVAEAMPTIGGAELDALVARLRKAESRLSFQSRYMDDARAVSDAITALRAQPDWKAMAERLGEALGECPPTSSPTITCRDKLGRIDAWWAHTARAALSDLAKMKGE